MRRRWDELGAVERCCLLALTLIAVFFVFTLVAPAGGAPEITLLAVSALFVVIIGTTAKTARLRREIQRLQASAGNRNGPPT